MSRKIREKDLSTPIIITSAHGESETLLEAIDIGVNGYILKPIDKDKLFNTITMFAKSIVLEKELKQKNKQLMVKSKNASLWELIQNISHQWRQPLSVISTAASTMQLKNEMGILELESIDKFTTDIVNTAQYLSDTIDMFRDNFVSTDEFKVQFKLVDIFKNIQTMLQSKLDDFNIKIILDINENIEIESLKKLFSQAILNLILNSIDKFEESDIEEKYIFITLKKDEDILSLIVKDNAGGIDDDIIDTIFEPYTTTHHKTQGKGLGLHTVYIIIVDILEKNITVVNEEFEYEGKAYKGASFLIELK